MGNPFTHHDLIVPKLISVQIEAAASTAAQVETAIENDATASALITVANAAGNDGSGALPGAMVAAALSGGDSNTQASLTTAETGSDNDLVFTSVLDGCGGNHIFVAYTTGGTAGSEAVTVTDYANKALTLTLPAVTRRSHVIHQINYSYSDTPAGGLTITDGSTVFSTDIVVIGPNDILFSPSKAGKPGQAMTIVLAAGGGSAVGKMDVSHSLE
jgi:hypothetical protein